MITFKFELEKQEKYYKDIGIGLKNGFFSREKFYVLPHLPEKFRDRVVYFPQNPNFEEVYKKHKKQIENLEKEWNKISGEIEARIYKLFPQAKSLDITISPQLFGTLGSYQRVTIRPRFDRTIQGVVMLLINALTHEFNKLDWEKKQRLTEENFKKINFDNFLPFPKPMITILERNFVGNLAKESIEYLSSLGFPQNHQKSLNSINLTKNESKIFNLLLENKNKLVSFDQIADILWKDNPDKYSEYAITKLVERLKKKIPKNFIHPQRGIGYILVS